MYTPEMTSRVYEEMRQRAATHLHHGRPVILDATHATAAQRAAALGVARKAGAPAVVVELRLTDDAALARIVNRAARPLRTSDADAAVYREQVERFEAPVPSEGPLLAFDSSQPPAVLAAEIAEYLQSVAPADTASHT
jgi:predicted kinase